MIFFKKELKLLCKPAGEWVNVAGKASYKLSNLTSLPSSIIALHFDRKYFWVLFLFVTPHTQRERGKGCGVQCLWTK